MFFNKIVSFFDEMKWIIILAFKNRQYEADCGHKTKERDWLKAFSGKIVIKVPLKNGKTPYCHRCLEKMTIRCAWCGEPIFISNSITLYSPKYPENFEILEGAVVYSQEPLRLVGCLRSNCAHTGGDRAGFWYPPGQVYRVLSPIEAVMMNPEKGAVSVGNLDDPQEALQLQSKYLGH